MKELIFSLILWITAHSNLAWDQTYPVITYMSQTQLCRAYLGPEAAPDCPVVALYSDTAGMALNRDFNPMSFRDQATLMHELVHHLQKNYPQNYECIQASEPEAYLLEHRWIMSRGATSEEAWEFMNSSPLTVFVLSQCPVP